MTSIFSPRRTKSSAKGGAEPTPETPATLATAHAAAFVKAKRDGDLLVTTHVEEKKGKELEHIVQILRFPMKSTGEQVLAKISDEFQLDKKKAEKLVPHFPRGGVYMDLTRPLDQYVMGTTETLELIAFKKPRGTLLVILYEMGKVEQIDVWSKTTVLGVLMSITAKTENTVNECILCTPEPVQELPLDLVVPKTAQKLVFLKRSRVTDKAPPMPLFPSRTYLIEQFNAKFQSTMYVPPESTTAAPTAPSIEPAPEAPAIGPAPEDPPREQPAKVAVLDVSAFAAPTTPMVEHTYTRHQDSASVASTETPREDDSATEHEEGSVGAAPPSPALSAAVARLKTSPSTPSVPSAAPNVASPLAPVPESAPVPTPNTATEPAASPQAPTPTPAPTPVPLVASAASGDVRAELLALSDAAQRYARLIALLEAEPIPEPRVVAATFKEWFTKDAQFKAFFNALGAVRVASLLKNVANALKA